MHAELSPSTINVATKLAPCTCTWLNNKLSIKCKIINIVGGAWQLEHKHGSKSYLCNWEWHVNNLLVVYARLLITNVKALYNNPLV